MPKLPAFMSRRYFAEGHCHFAIVSAEARFSAFLRELRHDIFMSRLIALEPPPYSRIDTISPFSAAPAFHFRFLSASHNAPRVRTVSADDS